MEFKEGNGWRCCYDPETGRYTAETGGVSYDLYGITKEIYVIACLHARSRAHSPSPCAARQKAQSFQRFSNVLPMSAIGSVTSRGYAVI